MLRVAAIQLRTSSSRQDTLTRVSSLIGKAATRDGAQLVCLPEAFTGIYGVNYFQSNAEDWLGEQSGTSCMSCLAKEFGIYVCGGVIETEYQEQPNHTGNKHAKLYNTVAAFGPDGEEIARYRKIHLSNVAVGDDQTSEGTILESGKDLVSFEVPTSDGTTWRVGLLNCYDLRFKEVSNLLTDEPPYGLGCHLLLYPSSWLKSTGDLGHWETLLKARALDGQGYVMGISNARVESQETVAFGHSSIMGPLGETLNQCQDDEADEVVSAVLDMKQLVDVRNRIPLSTTRRRDLYDSLLQRVKSMDVINR